MERLLGRWIGLAAAALMACAPGTEPPVKVMGLVLAKGGAYETRELELRTVADIVALRGSVLELVGGARIVIDSNDPLLQINGGNLSDEQLADVFVKAKGMAPRASYIDKNGVLWPADFHTWNLVTTYYNFERSFEYFQGVYDGRPTQELEGARAYYFPTFILADASSAPLVDNALFYPPVQAFAVLPFEKLQQVPLSINLGVIGHEFSHRVFNRRVYRGKAVPEPLAQWIDVTASSPAVNLLKSIDEGLADFHAYGVTCRGEGGCNPRFLIASVDAAVTDARDISQPDKCMTSALRNSLETLPVGQFAGQGLEYRVGTVLAAALYQAGNKFGRMDVLQKALLRAYEDPDPAKPGFAQLVQSNLETPQHFTLAAVANSILAHIDDLELKKLTCNELLDRLQLDCPSLPCAELPACPASSAKGTACPNINP